VTVAGGGLVCRGCGFAGGVEREGAAMKVIY
jgi:hypothetical protein